MANENKAKVDAAPKRERTRRALVAAAAELIGERGYEGTSLEAVAARAGMSRGAIYGNFASREALFLAVAESLWKPVLPAAASGATAAGTIRALGAAVAAEAAERRHLAIGALSFHLHVLKSPELRRRLVLANRQVYAAAAERLRTDLAREGLDADLPVPADAVVKAIHALIEGLVLTHILTPELVTEDSMVAAFELLSRAIPAADQP